MEIQVYTVSGITSDIKMLLESSFPPVWVEGEISNFVHHGSGHMYFSLKDDRATLRCVFFRQLNFRLRFAPENGMKVLALGEVSVYEPSGQYQLKVAELRPAGVGELQLAFEQLKARLDEEGLFDRDRKKEIPFFPRVVGVITSPTGAAVRDIISVVTRRCPPVSIVVCPVKVQGEGAADEIARAIRDMDAWGGADVLIAGRGGGSLEDLWAFNEEQVARAIAECETPVISAVGHETDFTIADFVADLRAPTPSAAAEQAVPDAAELAAGVDELTGRLVRAQESGFERAWQLLDSLERGLSPRRLLERNRFLAEKNTMLAWRLARAGSGVLESAGTRWELLRSRLDALNPARVLGRGYSLAADDSGRLVRDAASLSPGDMLGLTFARGGASCRVEEVQPGSGEFKLTSPSGERSAGPERPGRKG